MATDVKYYYVLMEQIAGKPGYLLSDECMNPTYFKSLQYYSDKRALNCVCGDISGKFIGGHGPF